MNLLNLCSVCASIVGSELGFFHQKSRYRIYEALEWEEFLRKISSNQNKRLGVYLPRTLSAHLKKDTEFLLLTFIHEFFGHGIFCEHSKIGRRIVSYEAELAGIEKQIFGVDELVLDTHFELEPSNPYYAQYRLLREEFRRFCDEHHDTYEGFGYWMEQYLAQKLGQNALFQQKKIGTPIPYLVIVQQFNDLVIRNGKKALLEQLEFG